VVAAQIPYPLLPEGGPARAGLTTAQVVAFLVASVCHAAQRRGAAFAVPYAVLAAALGLAAEVTGTRTGWPFGHYAYTHRLTPEVAGVPVIIPLGWAMTAYPALLAGRWAAGSGGRAAGRVRVALAGGALLAGWDLFLDPRMVAEGFWVWPGDGVARLNGIPLTNTVGWLAVGAVLVALLDALPDRERRPPGTGWPAGDGVPLFLLAWTYLSWLLACLAFFRQPTVALAGGVGMALPVLPRAVRLASRRRHHVAPRTVVASGPAAPSQGPR
jgi:putative membrane protein